MITSRGEVERFEGLQRERKAEMAQMEASELESGSADAKESAQVSSSDSAEPNPPVGPMEEDLILESMDTVVVKQPPTENYGTNPPQSQAVVQFSEDGPSTDDADEENHAF